MSRYLRRDDWPIARRGPWTDHDAGVAELWRDDLQENRAANLTGSHGGGPKPTEASERKTEADIQWRVQRARIAKLKADELEGGLIDRSLMERAMVGLAYRFRQSLTEIRVSLADRLPGDRIANMDLIDAEIEDALKRLSEEEEIQLASVEDVDQRRSKSKRRKATGAG